MLMRCLEPVTSNALKLLGKPWLPPSGLFALQLVHVCDLSPQSCTTVTVDAAYMAVKHADIQF